MKESTFISKGGGEGGGGGLPFVLQNSIGGLI